MFIVNKSTSIFCSKLLTATILLSLHLNGTNLQAAEQSLEDFLQTNVFSKQFGCPSDNKFKFTAISHQPCVTVKSDDLEKAIAEASR